MSGTRIKEAMRDAPGGPITQTELAKRTGILNSTLGMYVQGKHHLPIRAAKLIERGTKMPAAYLMGLVDADDMEFLQAPKHTRQALIRILRELLSATVPGGTRTTADPPVPDRRPPLT